MSRHDDPRQIAAQDSERNMHVPPPRIAAFLLRHHVLTLATCPDTGRTSQDEGDQPVEPASGLWCSNMFYAYIPSRNLLVFTSDEGTTHVEQIRKNPRVAVSVVLETKVVGKIKGFQSTGRVFSGRDTDPATAELMRRSYLKRFPYAALAQLNLWAFEPDYIKFTDNTLGFGKKLIWAKPAQDVPDRTTAP